MLQITIKDTKSNEVLYDDQVSVILMQAAEKDGVRSIRYITNDSSLTDLMNCVEATKNAVTEAKTVLRKVFERTLAKIVPSEGNDDE